MNGTHILVYPFLIFPTPCAFEWVSPNSPLPSPDNLCKRHYGKCKHVYSMQIKPFLNHFLRANAKNIIGSKLKLKFWTKENYFEFHEPGKYTRHYEYPYQIGPLIFIIILTRRHLTCTCHVLWPNGGKQRWEIQLHVYLQIETMNRSSMRTAKMLLHTITFQVILHNFLCVLCHLVLFVLLWRSRKAKFFRKPIDSLSFLLKLILKLP